MHHPKFDVNRLLLPHKEGGREIETYLNNTNDWMLSF